MKILLVESDQILANIISTLFARHGHKVLATADAQAAIAAADTQIPDAIILDLLLPGRSGTEFLYELRSYPDWQQIPVVVYSSLPASEVHIASDCFKQLDVQQFLYKPETSLTDLLSTINSLALASS